MAAPAGDRALYTTCWGDAAAENHRLSDGDDPIVASQLLQLQDEDPPDKPLRSSENQICASWSADGPGYRRAEDEVDASNRKDRSIALLPLPKFPSCLVPNFHFITRHFQEG